MALVVIVVLLVGLLGWFVSRPPGTTQVEPAPSVTIQAPSPAASPTAPDSPTPSPSPSAAAPSAAAPSAAAPSAAASIVPVSAAPPPSPSPSPTGRCQAPSAEGFVPVRYEIERLGSDEKVVSLGLDPEGAIAAPPLDEPRIASWWNQGPRPGSDAGKVLLSIHTYRKGGALGNELYKGGKSALQAGDRIVLHGAEGQVACYEFVEAKKVFVSDYDPNSSVMIDYDGTPLLNMIICWDYVKGSKAWNSRVFFYAKPVVGN